MTLKYYLLTKKTRTLKGTATKRIFYYLHQPPKKDLKKEKKEKLVYLSMVVLRWIKISTNSNAPSELNTRHEITNKNIPLVHNFHVKEMRERLTVKHGDDVRVNPGKEREAWRYVGSKHCAFVLLYSLPKEGVWPLEPEVV